MTLIGADPLSGRRVNRGVMTPPKTAKDSSINR